MFRARIQDRESPPSYARGIRRPTRAASEGPTILVAKLVAATGLAKSSTEARKLIAQAGVRLDKEKVGDVNAAVGAGQYLVQVGKLRAARVVVR